jgi:cellulose synthase/poly-beta-1,6-N-acetylglucosamine synthase-like glycosyltransferase
MISQAVHFFNVLLVSVLGYSTVYYLAVLTVSIVSLRELARERPSKSAYERDIVRDRLPGISVLMPAYNEEVVIVETVHSALGSDYPKLEVIVVSDGSKDRTVAVLVEEFGLTRHDPPPPGPIKTKAVRAVYRHPTLSLVVVDKDPSGAKADGVNCGINLAQHDWIVIMDGDEIAEPDALLRTMVDVVNSPVRVVGAGISLLPANGMTVEQGRVIEAPVPMNYWVGCQLIEYVASFLLSKPGMSVLGAMPNISGGFGVYDRNVVLAVGGLAHPHLGEDMDLVMRVHRYFLERGESYTMLEVPEAIVWTEFPSTLKVLKRQRMRWHRGLKQVLKSNQAMIFRPRYGRLGMLTLPFLLLFEWVAVPLESLGIVMLFILAVSGGLNGNAAIGLFSACQMLGTLITFSAVFAADKYLGQYRKRGDLVRLLYFAVLSQFGFRQLTLLWRLMSLRKAEHVWGEMTRTGYARKPGAMPTVTAPGSAPASVPLTAPPVVPPASAPVTTI